MERDTSGVTHQEAEPKRERLSDEEMGNLLSAIGNSETKALTLLSMQKGVIYSSHDLFRAMIDIQDAPLGWRISQSTPFDYCQYSLSPIGLVAQEVIRPDGNVIGFRKTKYGEEVGDPLAGMLLAFSERHPEISLYELFGSTTSPSAKTKEIETSQGIVEHKLRSPLTRMKIFWEIATAELPIRLKDLTERIGLSDNLSDQLNEMARTGLIEYESKGSDHPYLVYKFNADSTTQTPKPIERLPLMMPEIYEITKAFQGEFSIEEIADQYYSRHPEKRRAVNKTSFSTILKSLHKQGFLESAGFTYEEGSAITLNETQEERLVDLLTLLDRFQEQDEEYLRLGRSEAFQIINDGKRVSNLASKAKEASPMKNKAPLKETLDTIYQIIAQNPNSTSKMVTQILERDYNRTLRRNTVISYIRKLAVEGRIEKSKQARNNYWTVAQITQY